MKNNLLRQHGFSLVELLIAMALGLILTAGMIAVFSGNKRTSEVTTAMANMQESARFALQAIATDIRHAGFQGCLGIDNGSIADGTDAQILPKTGIFNTATTGSVIVSANDWRPQPVSNYQLPPGIEAVAGTHTIGTQGGTENRVPLEIPMFDGTRPSPIADVVLERNAGFSATVGSPVIIADCEQAELFAISQMDLVNDSWVLKHEASHNLSGALLKEYGNNGKLRQVTVTPFFSNLYFVGSTGLETENGDPVTSLYEQSYPFDPVSNPPTELIQGVENMRVSFGIQDNNGRVQYVTADDASFKASAVVSVQLGLLMSSWDRIANVEDNKTYVLAGQAIPASPNSVDGNTHAQDQRYRLAFNTTVKVRNRRVQQQ